MANHHDLILERLYAAEERLQDQAGKLDGKAGFLLVVLTFLAEITSHLRFSFWMQFTEIFALASSGALTIAALAILKYHVEPAETLAANWEDVSEANKAHPPDSIELAFQLGLAESSKDRIVHNEGLNDTKARLLIVAYVLMVIAFAIVVIEITSGVPSSGAVPS